jgi:hypothetical protein
MPIVLVRCRLRRLAGPMLVVAALVLAGCEAPVDARGPEDWATPPAGPAEVELIGHLTTATHAGDRGVGVYPDRAAWEPSFCIAYLDGRARRQDECRIWEGTLEWEGVRYPWTLLATWHRLHDWDDETIARLEIHAFDENGQPMAHWRGAMHPNAGFLTE